jgi:hypothetical protein
MGFEELANLLDGIHGLGGLRVEVDNEVGRPS